MQQQPPQFTYCSHCVLSWVSIRVELHDCMQGRAERGVQVVGAWLALSLSMLSLPFRSQRPDMHTVAQWQQSHSHSHSHSHCHSHFHFHSHFHAHFHFYFPYCGANTNTIRQMNKYTIQLGWAADAICICQHTHSHIHTLLELCLKALKVYFRV